MFRQILLYALMGVSITSSLSAQIKNSFNYRFDVRQAVEDEDRLGIDFDIRYEQTRDIVDPQGLYFYPSLAAKGFQVFDKTIRDIDALSGEFKLLGRYYRSGIQSLSKAKQARYRELSDRDPAAGGSGLNPEEENELNGFFHQAKKGRYYGTYDLHYRYESTQDLSTDQHALGGEFATEIPALHKLLDFLPSLCRQPDSLLQNFKPQPVRGYLGADYIADAEETRLALMGGDPNFLRLQAGAAWSTLVMNGLVLRLIWQAEYLPNAATVVKEMNRELNSFVQIWILCPVTDKTSVMIKYMDGRLPPNYENVSVGKVGLSLSLQ